MTSGRLSEKQTTSKAAVATQVLSQNPCDEGRWSRVAEAAYYKAKARGFESGHELEDWLAAEAEEQ